MEYFFDISAPAAFTFVSVFITIMTFIYKIWMDLLRSKQEIAKEKSDGDINENDFNKLQELDNRVFLLEKQVKEIPNKIDEMYRAIEKSDRETKKEIENRMETIRSLIGENRKSNEGNYNKLESRINSLGDRLYDLFAANSRGNSSE